MAEGDISKVVARILNRLPKYTSNLSRLQPHLDPENPSYWEAIIIIAILPSVYMIVFTLAVFLICLIFIFFKNKIKSKKNENKPISWILFVSSLSKLFIFYLMISHTNTLSMHATKTRTKVNFISNSISEAHDCLNSIQNSIPNISQSLIQIRPELKTSKDLRYNDNMKNTLDHFLKLIGKLTFSLKKERHIFLNSLKYFCELLNTLTIILIVALIILSIKIFWIILLQINFLHFFFWIAELFLLLVFSLFVSVILGSGVVASDFCVNPNINLILLFLNKPKIQVDIIRHYLFFNNAFNPIKTIVDKATIDIAHMASYLNTLEDLQLSNEVIISIMRIELFLEESQMKIKMAALILGSEKMSSNLHQVISFVCSSVLKWTGYILFEMYLSSCLLFISFFALSYSWAKARFLSSRIPVIEPSNDDIVSVKFLLEVRQKKYRYS